MKHTPVPWRLSHGPEVYVVGEKNDDDFAIAKIMGVDRKANAEFIVCAVNAHDELVAALELAQTLLLEATNTPPSSDARWTQIADALAKVRK